MSNRNRLIGRRIYTTCVDGYYLDKQKERREFSIELVGDLGKTQAQNRCAKILGTKNLIVCKIRVVSTYYSMPIETFIENAKELKDSFKEKEIYNG